MYKVVIPGWEERVIRVEHIKRFNSKEEAEAYLKQIEEGDLDVAGFDAILDVDVAEVVDGGIDTLNATIEEEEIVC